MANIINVDDENFLEEVIEKSFKIPVVVDFWASWCGPCMMLGPLLDNVVKHYEGKIILAKMSVEESQIVPQQYEISSIPAVKMFKDGEVVDEFVGAIPEKKIKEWIEGNL